VLPHDAHLSDDEAVAKMGHPVRWKVTRFGGGVWFGGKGTRFGGWGAWVRSGLGFVGFVGDLVRKLLVAFIVLARHFLSCS
jgi:hypothetical protein